MRRESVMPPAGALAGSGGRESICGQGAGQKGRQPKTTLMAGARAGWAEKGKRGARAALRERRAASRAMSACFIRFTAITASTAPRNLLPVRTLMRSCALSSDWPSRRSDLNQGWSSASRAVSRLRGSTTSSFWMRSFASADTGAHTWGGTGRAGPVQAEVRGRASEPGAGRRHLCCAWVVRLLGRRMRRRFGCRARLVFEVEPALSDLIEQGVVVFVLERRVAAYIQGREGRPGRDESRWAPPTLRPRHM